MSGTMLEQCVWQQDSLIKEINAQKSNTSKC